MSARDIIIGLDAGTSVIKAVAFDLEGRQIASAEMRNIYVRDEARHAVEQDLALTWSRAAEVLRQRIFRPQDVVDAGAGWREPAAFLASTNIHVRHLNGWALFPPPQFNLSIV